jgi:putative methyltransferase (TIGR04325 family)
MENKKSTFKSLAVDWLPPILLRFMRSVFYRRINFYGWYASWDDALGVCSGYHQEAIAKKVLNSTLLVKQNEASFERDSVLFDRVHYSWPVLSGLMLGAALEGGNLDVLDFGGALGTSFFQNKIFLQHLKNIKWSIVEQDHFVDLGRMYIEDDVLRFYKSIEEHAIKHCSNVILMSSVLQYLPNPYNILGKLVKQKPRIIIFDRTSFIVNGNKERIRIQKVPGKIYDATYPCWFLNKQKLINFLLENNYRLLESFDGNENLDTFANWEGLIFIQSNATSLGSIANKRR